MTSPAIIREAEGRRLARIAKAEQVPIRVKKGDLEITIYPDVAAVLKREQVDDEEEIVL